MNKNKSLFVDCLRRQLLASGTVLPAHAWLGATRAQAPAAKRPFWARSGVSSSRAALWIEAFRGRLCDRGWIIGRNISIEFGGKRLELLKETLPDLSRVMVLWNPTRCFFAAFLERDPEFCTAIGHPASVAGGQQLRCSIW